MKITEIIIRVLGIILLISAVGMGYMLGKYKDSKMHDKRPTLKGVVFLITVLIISITLLSLTHTL